MSLQVWKHFLQKAGVNHCRRKQSNLLPRGGRGRHQGDQYSFESWMTPLQPLLLPLHTAGKWGSNETDFDLCIKTLLDWFGEKAVTFYVRVNSFIKGGKNQFQPIWNCKNDDRCVQETIRNQFIVKINPEIHLSRVQDKLFAVSAQTARRTIQNKF